MFSSSLKLIQNITRSSTSFGIKFKFPSSTIFSGKFNNTSIFKFSTVASIKVEDKLQIDPSIKKLMQNLDNNIIRRDYYVSILNFFKDKNVEQNDRGLMQNLFMKYFEIAITKNIINSFTIHEIIPQVLKEAARLEINSISFWKTLNDLFNKNYHKMGPNLIFDFFNIVEEAYPSNPNVIHLKNLHFANMTRDKVIAFNVETLLNYMRCYVDFINDQSFVDEICKLIVIQNEKNKNLTLADIGKHLSQIVNIIKSSGNIKTKKINFDEVLIGLFPFIKNNFNSFDSNLQIEILKIFSQCKDSLSSKSFDFHANISELARTSDDKFRKNIETFTMTQVIEILQVFSQLEIGSNELFLELDRFIGMNIDSLKSENVLTVLESFVNAKKFREKLTLLLQKKVSDVKFEINFSDLCRIMKIYTDINEGNIYIYDKLHSLFVNSIHFLNLNDLSLLVYAYGANENLIGESYKILDKSEMAMLASLEDFEKNENVNSLIRILYTFTLEHNLENYSQISNRLKNILVKLELTKISFEKDLNIVCMLYNIFHKLNLKNEAVKNENLIIDNLKIFDKLQLKNLSVSAKSLMMNKNEKLIALIDGNL